MSRTSSTRRITEERISTVTTYVYKCDKCGRERSREDWEDGYAHELILVQDEEECVSMRRRRDYCPACMDVIWKALNAVIGADPDVEREPGWQDE